MPLSVTVWLGDTESMRLVDSGCDLEPVLTFMDSDLALASPAAVTAAAAAAAAAAGREAAKLLIRTALA